MILLQKRHFRPGQEPAWDTRWNEELTERGPNFLNYVQ